MKNNTFNRDQQQGCSYQSPGKITQVFTTFPGFAANITSSEAAQLSTNPDAEKIVADQKFNFVQGVMDNALYHTFQSAGSYKTYPGYSMLRRKASHEWAGTRWMRPPGIQSGVLDSGCDLSAVELNIDQAREKSFVPVTPSFNDEFGHGTHVAGIIGAKANNQGIVGVAPNARLVPVRVLDQYGQGTKNSILTGLDYIQSMVVAHNTADIINISLGFPQRNSSSVLD